MFQLLKRMVIILLLAAVVIGSTFAFAQSSYADSLSFGGGHERHNGLEFGDGDFPERSGEENGRFPDGGSEDHHEANIGRGLLELIPNIGIIALITLVVFYGQKLLNRLPSYKQVAPVEGKMPSPDTVQNTIPDSENLKGESNE